VGVLFGCASAPTAFERKFFSIETNVVGRVVVVTNASPDDSAFALDASGPDVGSVEKTAAAPGVAVVSDVKEGYTFTPNENAKRIAATAGSVAGWFGPFGELVSVLIGAGFGMWGYFRSTKQRRVAEVLAQVIETGRIVLETTPQGKALESEWRNWMVKHQAESKVMAEVIDILAGAVDRAAAEAAAQKLIAKLPRA